MPNSRSLATEYIFVPGACLFGTGADWVHHGLSDGKGDGAFFPRYLNSEAGYEGCTADELRVSA